MRLRSSIVLAGALVLATAAATSAGRASRDQQARPHGTPSATKVIMQVYKSPTCGCCKSWVERMQAAGFDMRVTDLSEAALQKEKARLGVSDNLQSCHTAVVNGYVVEGHVPAADIQRMLKEKPKIAGIAAPGMPRGSPGMEVPGGAKDAYDVIAFTKAGKTSVYASH
jgi:hypothetical protein